MCQLFLIIALGLFSHNLKHAQRDLSSNPTSVFFANLCGGFIIRTCLPKLNKNGRIYHQNKLFAALLLKELSVILISEIHFFLHQSILLVMHEP